MADYSNDALASAFPILFPFGFSGMPGNKALREREKREAENKKTELHVGGNLKCSCKSVLKRLLRQSSPGFHGALFNLIAENMLMKDIIFQKGRMFCETRHSKYSKMC